MATRLLHLPENSTLRGRGVYISIVIHRQICFVLSELISVARHISFPHICIYISIIIKNLFISLPHWAKYFNVKVPKLGRCPWCNGYRRRKWTRRQVFKSWTRLIAFHIALIPLGKVWIQLFSLQLWVGRTRFLRLGEATSLEGKIWLQTC